MQIHESHQMRPSSAGDIKIHACASCGATDVPLNEQIMAKSCMGGP
jgi:hypothetical protein